MKILHIILQSYLNFNSLLPIDAICLNIFVNFGSVNVLLPNDIKTLPEPVSIKARGTYNNTFQKKYSWY